MKLVNVLILIVASTFLGLKFGRERVTSGDSTWTMCGGLQNSTVSSFVQSGSNLLAGSWGGEVYLSRDSGATWSAVASVPSVDMEPPALIILTPSVSTLAIGTTVFAGAGNALSGGILVSMDSGMSWTEEDSTFTHNVNCFALIGDSVFAGTESGIFVTTNYGKSWQVFSHELSGVVSILVAAGTNLYAAYNGFTTSTDGGMSWLTSDSGLTNHYVTGIATIGNELFVGTFKFPGDTAGGVYTSADQGKYWSPADYGLTSFAVNTLISSGTDLYAGTNSGVFVSTDNGASWIDISIGTPVGSSAVTSLAVYDGFLFAGTNGNGTWRRPALKLSGVVVMSGNTPTRYSLLQNYPNPFNPSTAINYQLPTNSLVVLKVYDVLGREIRTLVNERQSAGSHSVTFNATTLSSGVYLYRLDAGTYHNTKKLLLLK